MANVVYDNSSPGFRFGGGEWSGALAERFFGGSAAWPAFAADENGDTGAYGSLNYTFHGTSIAFFGNTPNARASQSFLVSVDGGAAYNTSYTDPAPPSSRQWYLSPTLTEGTHDIAIGRIAGTSVDFVVVAAGSGTPLEGETLIVDDADEEVVYEGAWARDGGGYAANDDPSTGLAYGNSTHRTTAPGASATFRFSGSAVSVYGLYTWSTPGSLEVLYTLDGTRTSRTYVVTPTTPELIAGVRTREHFLLFASNSTLNSGAHTLRIELARAVNHSLALDYILYTPDFATLAEKPTLAVPSSTTTSTTSTSSIAPPPVAASGKGPAVGAIVGGVLGGVAGLLLLLVSALVIIRRRKRDPETSPNSPPQTRTLGYEPFTLPSPTTTATTPMTKGEGASALSIISPTRIPTGPNPGPQDPPPANQPSLLSSISPSMSASCVATRALQSASPTPPREAAAGAVAGIEIPPGSEADPGFRARMRRLEELVQELNRAMEAGDGDARLAELRGRIAELTRRNSGAGGAGMGGAPPPAYEPRGE